MVGKIADLQTGDLTCVVFLFVNSIVWGIFSVSDPLYLQTYNSSNNT